jgi:predicted nucleic acid-binding Zn ribbon protein
MKSLKETLGAALVRVAEDAGTARLLGPLWVRVVGTTVAGHARVVRLEGGVLTVQCDSKAWRDALAGESQTIIGQLHSAGAGEIRSVVFEVP